MKTDLTPTGDLLSSLDARDFERFARL